MLAGLGFLTVGALFLGIVSRRLTPLVALVLIPVAAAALGGFGLGTAKFVLTGIQQIAPVATMFVFAILYFGIISDAGTLDPIINGILRRVGAHPTRVVIGSALLALLVHLDGSGAVTFLVAVPAMLPLYDRLRIDRRVLACVTSMAAGVNFLPWTGPMLRASAALHVPVATLFRPLVPVQIVGLAFVFAAAWYLGRRYQARPTPDPLSPGRVSGDVGTALRADHAATFARTLTAEEQQLRRGFGRLPAAPRRIRISVTSNRHAEGASSRPPSRPGRRGARTPRRRCTA